MNKQPDFGNDLAALNNTVSAEVGDVLQALQQKRTQNRSSSPEKAEKNDSHSSEAAVQKPDAAVAPDQSDAAITSSRRQRSPSRTRLVPTMERDEPLENVTTRLKRSTNELLTEAALRQRLKKAGPATRQDIVEAALGDWFRKYGYLRSRENPEEN